MSALSRRAAFSLLPALGATFTAAAAPSSDAQLIALCDEMVANEAEKNAIYARYWDLVGDWSYTDEEVWRIDELGTRYRELDNEIAATPAVTLDGVRAKARACRTKLSLDGEGKAIDGDELAASIFDDIIERVRA